MQKVFVTDMDDVLNELLDSWLLFLNTKYQCNVKREDVVDWDMAKAYPNLTPDQIYGVLREEALWKHVRPKYDAIFYINKIRALGIKVLVATASSYNTIQTKVVNALLPYFEFSFKDIIMISDKSLLRCDWIVDDYHENIKNSQGVRILFNAPYNKDCNPSYYDYRVDNWERIYGIVESQVVCKATEIEVEVKDE